jgi:hypothetical protein
MVRNLIVDMLIDALASPNTEAQNNAGAALVAFGPVAIDGLVLRLGRYESACVQIRIAEVLSLIWTVAAFRERAIS